MSSRGYCGLTPSHHGQVPMRWWISPEALSYCQQRGMLMQHDDFLELTTLNYFATSISVRLYDPLPNGKALLCQSLNQIERLHRLASDYQTYDGITNIKSINNAPTAQHTIDPELTRLIAEGIDWAARSDGHFNIAMGPVVQLWRARRFACEQGQPCQLPDSKALLKAKSHIEINQVQLDITANTLTLGYGMSLDLGGIAKGWMAERVLEQLQQAGANNLVINAGGNVRHIGQHPSGRPFSVAIEDPVCKKSQYQKAGCDRLEQIDQHVIRGQDLTVVSSGNYLKYFEVEGVEYHHIIDPKNMAPKQGLVSVSVILSDHHQEADPLSTTLFLLPFNEAQALVESLPHVEAIWTLNEQGEQRFSSGIGRYL